MAIVNLGILAPHNAAAARVTAAMPAPTDHPPQPGLSGHDALAVVARSSCARAGARRGAG